MREKGRKPNHFKAFLIDTSNIRLIDPNYYDKRLQIKSFAVIQTASLTPSLIYINLVFTVLQWLSDAAVCSDS